LSLGYVTTKPVVKDKFSSLLIASSDDQETPSKSASIDDYISSEDDSTMPLTAKDNQSPISPLLSSWSPRPHSIMQGLISPPVKSGDGISLNHEFAMHSSSSDCDLASLSLGEVEKNDTKANIPGSTSNIAKPFSTRVYSPENKSGIMFCPMDNNLLLRPSRLTSWVAGGYWTPPNTRGFEKPLSRSSSQSSGFVSASVASVKNMSQSPGFGYPSPVNSVYGDCDRCSILHEQMKLRSPTVSIAGTSESIQLNSQPKAVLDELSQSNTSLNQWIQPRMTNNRPKEDCSPNQRNISNHNSNMSLNEKLSLTVTITPIGIIFSMSVAVNLAVLYLYMFNAE